MRRRRGRVATRVNGEEVTASGAPHLHCPKCGEKMLSLDEWGFVEQQALARYRKKYRLLSGDDIRALRERLGLTQAALADLLRLGPNTISRWEAGRNVQTAAMNALLELVRDVPGALRYLRAHRHPRPAPASPPR